MSSFRNKTIIITGASEGIGRCLALQLASQNVKLVLAARNEQRLESLKSEVEALGSKAAVYAGDLSSADNAKALVATALDNFGAIDTLINNAGIDMWARFEKTDNLETFDKIFKTNFHSVLYCTYYALEHLKKSRGSIAAVSSVSGFLPVPGHSFYGASKFAIHGFLESLRLEIEPEVNITIVAPDFVKTELHKKGLDGSGKPMGKSVHDGITAETCAKMALDGIRAKKRLVITSPRGKFAYALRGLLPEFIDGIVKRNMRTSTLFD